MAGVTSLATGSLLGVTLLDWLVFALVAAVFAVVSVLLLISAVRLARQRAAAEEGARPAWWERELVLLVLTTLLTALLLGLVLRDMLAAAPAPA